MRVQVRSYGCLEEGSSNSNTNMWADSHKVHQNFDFHTYLMGKHLKEKNQESFLNSWL